MLAASLGLMLAEQVTAQTFKTLYKFTALHQPNLINSDGASPTAGLILSGNTLYGTTVSGGISGYGTVFGLHTSDSGLTNLYSFTSLLPDYTSPFPNSTNNDGAGPWARLILFGNTLFGTT